MFGIREALHCLYLRPAQRRHFSRCTILERIALRTKQSAASLLKAVERSQNCKATSSANGLECPIWKAPLFESLHPGFLPRSVCFSPISAFFLPTIAPFLVFFCLGGFDAGGCDFATFWKLNLTFVLKTEVCKQEKTRNLLKEDSERPSQHWIIKQEDVSSLTLSWLKPTLKPQTSYIKGPSWDF